MTAPCDDGVDARDVLERIRAALTRQESEAPWALGLTLLGLAKRLRIPEAQLHSILQTFVEERHVAYRGGYYATPGFVPVLSDEQRQFFERHIPTQATTPNAPVDSTAVMLAMKAANIVGLAQAFDTLVEFGTLVRVGDHLYGEAQIERLRREIGAALTEKPRMTVAELRDLIGTSRKHVVPLLEWFDRAGFTVREGDHRLLVV